MDLNEEFNEVVLLMTVLGKHVTLDMPGFLEFALEPGCELTLFKPPFTGTSQTLCCIETRTMDFTGKLHTDRIGFNDTAALRYYLRHQYGNT